MSPPITAVEGNSTVPTLVCLTPKTVRIPVSCSKDNTGENRPWGELIAQDELREEGESSVSFCDGHTAHVGQLEMVRCDKELLEG